MRLIAAVAVVIVGYRNATDVAECLHALAAACAEPPFDIFIAENGGPAAMDALIVTLVADGGPCRAVREPDLPVLPSGAPRRGLFRLVTASGVLRNLVRIAEMPENLGYAGAINAWLRPLLGVAGWQAVWILNPDTRPTPSALGELARYSAQSGKSMVGSRITPTAYPGRVQCRGLAWRKWVAKALAVDHHAPVDPAPDAHGVESRLIAPCGASVYVTRDLIERIGLMDERYFLYFEDLEWGCRAQPFGGIGYADRSVVPHKGGTTVGTAVTRATLSPLAVYLEMRNGILFVGIVIRPGWPGPSPCRSSTPPRSVRSVHSGIWRRPTGDCWQASWAKSVGRTGRCADTGLPTASAPPVRPPEHETSATTAMVQRISVNPQPQQAAPCCAFKNAGNPRNAGIVAVLRFGAPGRSGGVTRSSWH